ncbi:Hypothetical protein ABZS17D1_01824 [Kosakonia cowanii]
MLMTAQVIAVNLSCNNKISPCLTFAVPFTLVFAYSFG